MSPTFVTKKGEVKREEPVFPSRRGHEMNAKTPSDHQNNATKSAWFFSAERNFPRDNKPVLGET